MHLQNVQNSHGNFPHRREGKRAISQNEGDDESPIGNHPQKKFMQSAINATHSWQRKPHFGQVYRRRGKGVKIDDTDNLLKKKQKLMEEAPIPSHLPEHHPPGHGNLATANNGNFLNDIFGTFADEYGGRQNELAHQFNPSGFTHQHGNMVIIFYNQNIF